MERYFIEPYRFIPPFRSTFWCRLVGKRLIPRHLHKKMGVQTWKFQGVELYQQQLARQAGILIASNHCRWSDPMILGVMGTQINSYLYYVASYHLFKQSRVMGWFLNRLGGYSIWREGTDRESLRATASILASAERPVVLFPEGTWFRQNDRVGPLQEGVSLIIRQAIKQSERPIVIQPAALKYWMLKDPRPELCRRLERLESKLHWKSQEKLDLVERIEKLGNALLALKEIEHLGHPQSGTLDDRITQLVVAIVGRLELVHLGKNHQGWILERIRRLRQTLVRQLLDKTTPIDQARQSKHDLTTLLFSENLSAHSQSYLREHPSLERLVETVQRIEETLTDAVEIPVVPMGCVVQLGAALDARELMSARTDQFIPTLRNSIQGLLDQLLDQGPPPEWNCPARVLSGAVDGSTRNGSPHSPNPLTVRD